VSKTDEPRVRVIVKKGHGGGHHGGAWKVAYADFVTTMMALFIVLWIVGQNAAVKEAIAAYFRNPGAFSAQPKPSVMPGGVGILPSDLPPKPPQTPGTSDEAALEQAAAALHKAILENPAFASVRDQVKIEITPEGLRIELMEQDSSPFFKVGSAVLVYPMKPILEKLEAVLVGLPNHITVEGHTDSRQYSEWRNYSNWELSTDRANAARRAMEAAGLPVGRIDRVVGMADRLLLTPGDPMNPKNRRISILVRREEGAAAAATPATPRTPEIAGAPAGATPTTTPAH